MGHIVGGLDRADPAISRDVCQSWRVRPTSWLWYLGAVVVVMVGVMVATAVGAGAWGYVRDATLVNLNAPVDAKDGSVAVFTDVVQPDRDVTCTATPAAEKGEEKPEPTEIPAAELDLQVSRDDGQWFLIGFLKKGEDGLTVRCTPADEAADSASYRVAAVDGWWDRAQLGSGIANLSLLVGLGLAAWTFWTRRKSHRSSEGT